MKSINSTAVIFSAAAVFTSLLYTATAQAPSLAPIPALLPPPAVEPFSPPLGPSAEGPSSVSNDCLTPLANMSDCLSFVTEGSKATAPDPNCCPEAAGLVESNPVCLCQLLSNSSLTESFGIKIDLARALQLPSLCRLNTPPVSTCAAIGFPIPPVASEGPMADIAPSGAQSPGSLASSPSAGGNDNGASFISSSLDSFFVASAFSLLLTFF